MENLCNLSDVFMEKRRKILLPEWSAWRLHGDNVESDNFYGDFIDWGFHAENMINQITRQSPY